MRALITSAATLLSSSRTRCRLPLNALEHMYPAAVFYLPDKSEDWDYMERIKRYGSTFAEKAEINEEANRRFEAEKKMEKERLSIFFVDHVIEITRSNISSCCQQLSTR